MITQPEAIVVEPETHAIMFTPEIVVAGYERKQCCYLDKCTTVPLESKCDPICYEPCDSPCTGRCMVNPQCPHECDRIRKEQFKLRYRIWLAGKLNEIKQKYRDMATACLLRTRLAFVGEVQNYYQAAKSSLGNIPIVADGGGNLVNAELGVTPVQPTLKPLLPANQLQHQIMANQLQQQLPLQPQQIQQIPPQQQLQMQALQQQQLPIQHLHQQLPLEPLQTQLPLQPLQQQFTEDPTMQPLQPSLAMQQQQGDHAEYDDIPQNADEIEDEIPLAGK